MEVVIFLVCIMRVLVCYSVFVINVVGGIGYGLGILMLIKDYINMIGINFFIGENFEEFGLCFLDMLDVYIVIY